MKNKRKICVVITARPSYARIKTVLIAMKNNPKIELQIILTGSTLLQKYGNIEEILKKDGLYVNKKIYCVIEADLPIMMCKTTGIAIIELSTAFQTLNPDIVISIADRFETIATSLAASYQNITLVHMQGGEVTGNIDEKVRHANTKLADIHFVSNEDSRKRVIKMGEEEQKVLNMGCPSIDIAKEVLENPEIDFDPLKKYGGVGPKIKWKDGYLVVLQHPVTTEFKKSREQFTKTLEVIKDIGMPTFWLWPNLDIGTDGASKAIRIFRENYDLSNIHFFKNLEPHHFLKIIKNSKCLIGNSSVGIRESAFLGIPVVNIGTRQNKRLRGKNVIDCDYQKDQIMNAIKKQISRNHFKQENIYGDGNSGKKISDYLETCELNFYKTITY